MLAVGLPEEEAVSWLAKYDGRISVAAVNSPASATLSGDPAALEHLSTQMTAKQIFNRALRVNIAYHSAQMDPLEAELLNSLANLNTQFVHTPLYSTVTGGRAEGTEFDAAYWWRNVREPVRFRAAINSLISDGFDCFLEVGPHPVLASSIAECLSEAGRKGTSFCSLRRGEDERSTMLSSLGSLYAAGLPVDWLAFRSPSARFVRLPSYPWQRERHWAESEASIADRTGVPVHPLLGRRVSSAQPLWETEINTRLLAWLEDHAIRGTVVFPGAGYVEMALAAAREVYGAGAVALEDIRFERALFLPASERPRVQIAIDAEEGTFEIHSRTGNAPWVRNARGRLVQECGTVSGRLETSLVQERCSPALDKEQCYAMFAKQGFQYGPAFQKIDRMQTGDGEAIAWLSDMDADAEYQLHPAILDNCFQVLVATDPFRAEDGSSKTYLPVGIKRIRLLKRPQGSMWAQAHLTRRDKSGATGSISVCDETGDLAVEIEDFEVKALDNSEGSLSRDAMDRNLYDVRWVAAPEISEAESMAQPGCWVLFADKAGVADAMAARLRSSDTAVVLVRPGASYSFDETGLEVTLNPAVAEHSVRLMQNVAKAVPSQLTGIAHLWNLDLSELPQSSADFDSAEDIGSLSVLHLVQAVVHSGMPARLWAITRGAQPVGHEKNLALMQSVAWGLGRVVGHQEHINLWGGLIDLDPAAPSGEIDALLAEMMHTSQEDQVAFRSGQRYTARLERCSDLEAALPVRLRSDASYVITGAFGALGMLTARWMVRRGARRLILMGRTAMPERARWNDANLKPEIAEKIAAVRALEAMGATVTLAPVDVADASQLDAFLREYDREGWPAIRGVIHSAGLVRDQLLVQMEAGTFSNVLRPKVRGAYNLHRALAGKTLDFFVLYSSIGSLVAATGQANYAAGNAFLDALAHHRRRNGLPALAINWGPWAVGMVSDLNLVDHYAARGLDCITPDGGMAYLARLIGQRAPQAAVLSADWRKLASYQPKVSAMIAHLAEEAASEASGATGDGTEDFLQAFMMAEPDDHAALMQQHLQGLAARVLRMEAEKVDTGQPLSALGIDSMMAMELKNRIELSLRIPVSVLDLLKGVSIAEFAASLLPRLMEENAELRSLLDELEQVPGPETLPSAADTALAATQQ
jgi:acyl transferase domain-containing protein